MPSGTRDLTFPAPKSVSVLMALLPAEDERTTKLFASHDTAVNETIAWISKEAAFARSGPAFLDTTGLSTQVIRHHSTINQQPHLHSHVLVAPEVVGLDDRIHRLDWPSVDQAMVAAPALYRARLRNLLTSELGASWSRHRHESEWEITGLPEELLARWSDTTCFLPGVPQTIAVRGQ